MLSHGVIFFRLALAALLGGLVGIDRERLSWAAGLRTHMLVCLGSALIMIVSAFGFSEALENSHVVLDPSRVAAQVVSGIGFLGAGTILFRRNAIRGLTTAAGLWSVAGIGLAVGGGLYAGAVAATILILLVLAGLKPLERRVWPSRQHATVRLAVDRQSLSVPALEAALSGAGIQARHILFKIGNAAEENEIELGLSDSRRAELANLVEMLRGLPGVRTVRVSDSQAENEGPLR